MTIAILVLAFVCAMFAFVVVLQDGERRIPVQYSKKMVGRKLVGGQSSHIPLKVNTAGVIPVIFASSIMSFPVVRAHTENLIGDDSTVLPAGLYHNRRQNPDDVKFFILVPS